MTVIDVYGYLHEIHQKSVDYRVQMNMWGCSPELWHTVTHGTKGASTWAHNEISASAFVPHQRCSYIKYKFSSVWHTHTHKLTHTSVPSVWQRLSWCSTSVSHTSTGHSCPLVVVWRYSSWVWNTVLQRTVLLPTQRGYRDSLSRSLGGWSSGVWWRHRWSIVGVLTKIQPPPPPPNSSHQHHPPTFAHPYPSIFPFSFLPTPAQQKGRLNSAEPSVRPLRHQTLKVKCWHTQACVSVSRWEKLCK